MKQIRIPLRMPEKTEKETLLEAARRWDTFAATATPEFLAEISRQTAAELRARAESLTA